MSELEVKHYFVLVEGDHQHDGKSKQHPQILQHELAHRAEAMLFVVTVAMQHFRELSRNMGIYQRFCTVSAQILFYFLTYD